MVTILVVSFVKKKLYCGLAKNLLEGNTINISLNRCTFKKKSKVRLYFNIYSTSFDFFIMFIVIIHYHLTHIWLRLTHQTHPQRVRKTTNHKQTHTHTENTYIFSLYIYVSRSRSRTQTQTAHIGGGAHITTTKQEQN